MPIAVKHYLSSNINKLTSNVSSVLSKFLSFALVGILGTLAHYTVLFALVEWQNIQPLSATAYGAIAGLLVNYFLNFKLTFNSGQRHTQTFPKFALIACCGMGFNVAFMAILIPHFYYLYAQIMTTVLVLVWNFFANILWTFKMDKTSETSLLKITALIKKPYFIIGLVLTMLLIRLLTLSLYPLYDPSESRYAEMARKMVETGNWVTPMIEYGVPFWGKPPLTIWLTAGSLNLVGINEFAARLPSVVLNVGVAWIIYYLVRIQKGSEKALSALLILSSTVLFFVMTGTVAMDLAMNFGITLALAAFWLALRGEKALWGYLFFFGLSIGLMAKGPITLVLCGTSIGLWTLLTGRWLDIWQRIPWIRGTLLMLCLCAPWYWLAELRTPGFLEYFFIGEHWKRFTEPGWKGDLYGVGRGHAHGMIWLYWLGGSFPWSFILLYKLSNKLLHKEAKQLFYSGDGWLLYGWLWMLTPLLFFSISANIIWTYVLPSLAGLALVLADSLTGSRVQRAILSLLVPLLFLGLVFSYQRPESDFFPSQKRLVEAYSALANTGERLIYLNEKIDYSAQFYLRGKVIEIPNLEALQQHLATANHDYYVIRNPILDSLPDSAKAYLQPVKTYGRYTLFHATDNTNDQAFAH
ncbi:phospholipid carrier-dependent glycosyltransferase [Methylomonas sp. AM2-LC]|uniref:phospholipid carrier-dependent glycosyltransferase n=1 Tax=Methylomonas sp. AM2-LC TaxID=3153301 RepID=UPI003264C138